MVTKAGTVVTRVGAVVDALDPDHPLRLALARSGSSTIQCCLATSRPVLSTREFVRLTAGHMTDSVRDQLFATPEFARRLSKDVGALAGDLHVDRAARRLAFAAVAFDKDVSAADQEATFRSLTEGPGRDDFLISVLPRWVYEDYDFPVADLAPQVGALAGTHLLAATSPNRVSDGEILQMLQSPPESWAHPEAGEPWHRRSFIGSTLQMLMTHRPGLVGLVANDPELVRYALGSPHWEPEYAHQLEGVDLENGVVTEAATEGTAFTLLSLVWHPKTPQHQAEQIRKVAEHGASTTPFTKSWDIVLNASTSRTQRQPGHVTDFENIQDLSLLSRLVRRIHQGVKSAPRHGDAKDETLNGPGAWEVRNCVTPTHLWWPTRFGEVLAILPALASLSYGQRSELSYASSILVPRLAETTLPQGSWSRKQVDRWGGYTPPNGGLLVDVAGTPPPSWAPRTVGVFQERREIRGWARQISDNVPAESQDEAWQLLASFIEEDTQLTRDHVATVVAVMS